MDEVYKKRIWALVQHKSSKFSEESYLFPGKRKDVSRFQAKMALVTDENFPESIVEEAIDFLDKTARETSENGLASGNRPETYVDWRDGDTFPSFMEPKDLALILFTTMGVSTSGTLKYLDEIPKWISDINPAIVPNSRVKEHDVKAGISAALRKYRRERTDEERESGHTFTVDEIITYRESILSAMKIKAKKIHAEKVKFDPKLQQAGVQEFLKMFKLTKAPEKSKESARLHQCYVYWLMHWMWAVKRRLNGLPTKNEICFIFLGRQGIGKSYLVDRLCSVMKELVMYVEISDLVDSRQAPSSENYTIVVLDEISKAERTAISRFKSWITAAILEYRPLFSNAKEVCDKNAQAIGTSNFPLYCNLKDTSGMRRFAEVPSEQEGNVLFQGVDELDILAMWKSVDENLEYGYYGEKSEGKSHFAEMVAIQEDTRDKSPVEEYLWDMGYVDDKGQLFKKAETEWYDMELLLLLLNSWADARAWKKFTPKYLRGAMANMHLEMKRSNNKRLVKLSVPEGGNPAMDTADSKVGI